MRRRHDFDLRSVGRKHHFVAKWMADSIVGGSLEFTKNGIENYLQYLSIQF